MAEPQGKEEGASGRQLEEALQEAIEEGQHRMGRSWPGLLSTGLVGGIDVSVGVLALLVVQQATGMRVLGALAFGIGFIALTIGRSELFTENFLVPVAAVVAGKARVGALLRLWAGTLAMNLVGAWVFAWLLMGGLPRLESTAAESSRLFIDLGIGWNAFALGLVAGIAITLMTWLERSSRSEVGRIVVALSIGFVLAAAPLNHVVVVSAEVFAAIHAGVDVTYGEWAATAGWAALANMIGGLLFVTLLRLIQAGIHDIFR